MTETDKPKATRHRSPNHPSLSLGDAIERAKNLFDVYAKAEVPVATALRQLGYTNTKSSTANSTVASLLAYDLVSSSGKGEKRKIAVNERAERIIRNAPDRNELIKAAALTPGIHEEVYAKFVGADGIAHNDILKQYLLWDREGGTFNEDSVDPFINRFRATLSYAGLEKTVDAGGGHLGGDGDDQVDPEVDPPDLQEGSFVQWTSAGVDQFKSPRKVLGFSDDGDWAFVEGSQTGIAVSELAIVEAPQESKSSTPPANPLFGQREGNQQDDLPPPKEGSPYISFPLSDGSRFELRLDHRISAKDFRRLKTLIDLSEDSLVEGENDSSDE